MKTFTHNDREYRDCWIETSVRHPGGKNMDGWYIAGHYENYEAAEKALAELNAKHPKSYSFIILLPA